MSSSDPVMNPLDSVERSVELRERRVSEESTLTELLKESPFQQLFDLSCTRLERTTGEVEVAMRYTASVERSPGTRQYHGGAIASLIDIAGDYALWAVLGYGVPTINIRIDYLRPASDTRLRAQARVRKAGRTVGVVDIDVLDDQDRLIAIGRGTYGTKEG
jgi:uncharacterized protein (TIGR00369 family)